MARLQIGEQAVCVKPGGNWTIKEGQSYLVLGLGSGMVSVLVDGTKREYFDWRFEPIEKPKYSTPNGKRKHYDVIVAWAEGADIQYRFPGQEWRGWSAKYSPPFDEGAEYRTRPEKSDALIAAENQLAEAERAVKAAKKAVQQAQEG